MRFPDLQSAFTYIESFTNFEKITPQSVRDFKQDRMYRLLEYFNHPEGKMELIHIAGSKGKGSTAIFLASILTEAGHKTGLYTSPHVVTYKERISMAGTFFPEDLYIRCVEAVAEMLEKGYGRDLAGEDQDPTTFELLTLLAFLVFREAGCSHGIIETGIGGRLDATNLIRPRACVLTPVELEHTDILGDTIEKIAFEKAGIIKKGTPVFSAEQLETVAALFEKTAEEKDADIVFLPRRVRTIRNEQGKKGNLLEIIWNDGNVTSSTLSMLGDFQGENAALAALTLRELGWADHESIVRGMSRATLPGRMEMVKDNPPVVLDGAHTPSSLRRLCMNFRKIFLDRGICIYGNVTGKRIEEMAEIVAPYFSHIIVSTPGTFKKSDPLSVYEALRKHHDSVIFQPSPEDALREAYRLSRGNLPILVSGSFYMIGEIRKLIY